MNAAYLNAAFGGLLIGTSALLLMYFYGRVAGISGIFYASITNIRSLKTSLPQILFAVGLILGAGLYYFIKQESFPSPIANMPTAVIAGILVGFGSKLGGGCTSGHGVCGISLFSLRSLSATITFIFFGMLIVGVLGYVF
jgi:uncharacterized membrane protein YedE/YeeE